MQSRPKNSACRRRRNAMLSSTSFSNNPFFAKALRQQGLADGVIDFVRTSVVQILALEPNFATCMARQGCRIGQRAWPTNKITQQFAEAPHERFIAFFAALKAALNSVQGWN